MIPVPYASFRIDVAADAEAVLREIRLATGDEPRLGPPWHRRNLSGRVRRAGFVVRWLRASLPSGPWSPLLRGTVHEIAPGRTCVSVRVYLGPVDVALLALGAVGYALAVWAWSPSLGLLWIPTAMLLHLLGTEGIQSRYELRTVVQRAEPVPPPPPCPPPRPRPAPRPPPDPPIAGLPAGARSPGSEAARRLVVGASDGPSGCRPSGSRL